MMRWVAGAAAAALTLLIVPALLAAALGAAAQPTAAGSVPAAPASKQALADIPSDYLRWYAYWTRECPGLGWNVVAAIGKLESDHGRSPQPGVHSGTNAEGAAGPMQFGIGGQAGDTWAAYRLDGDGDGTADVYAPADAIRSAYGYLCAHGASTPAGLDDAVFAYNLDRAYVDQVFAQAARYAPVMLASSADPAALLDHPRLHLSEAARRDLELSRTRPGWIDARVLGTLGGLLTQGHTVSVSVLRTGHTIYVRGTNRVSNHALGRAVDISEMDGQPVTADHTTARAVVERLVEADGPRRPDEVGSPFTEFSSLPNAFTDADHQDHLHIGWGTN